MQTSVKLVKQVDKQVRAVNKIDVGGYHTTACFHDLLPDSDQTNVNFNQGINAIMTTVGEMNIIHLPNCCHDSIYNTLNTTLLFIYFKLLRFVKIIKIYIFNL